MPGIPKDKGYSPNYEEMVREFGNNSNKSMTTMATAKTTTTLSFFNFIIGKGAAVAKLHTARFPPQSRRRSLRHQTGIFVGTRGLLLLDESHEGTGQSHRYEEYF